MKKSKSYVVYIRKGKVAWETRYVLPKNLVEIPHEKGLNINRITENVLTYSIT